MSHDSRIERVTKQFLSTIPNKNNRDWLAHVFWCSSVFRMDYMHLLTFLIGTLDCLRFLFFHYFIYLIIYLFTF